MANRLDKWEAQHRRNVERYAKMIDDIYKEAVREAASLSIPLTGIFSPDKPFSFKNYPLIRQRVNNLLESLKNSVEVAIVNGVRSEWTLAGDKNNELCRRVFGDNVGKLTDEQYRRYYSNNNKARDAFIARKIAGLNLSDRVWNYTNQFKEEIEMGLDLGLRDGLSADEMSRTLRQYLKYPDRLFRRVRDEHGNLHLSKRAAAFHPGQGVYRSSYKNARRLTATETNMAYRTADYVRHQQLDFVVGIEVHLSGNHTLGGKPFEDICDDLKGRYPKDFKFTGWHPLCRCYTTTILKTPEEMDEDDRRIMEGVEPMPSSESRNFVPDVPEGFGKWIDKNTERIESAKSLPYFMRDNEKYIKPLTITPQARAGADEAQKFNEEMMRAADVRQVPKAQSQPQSQAPKLPVLDGSNYELTKAVSDVESEIRQNKTHETGVLFNRNGEILIDKRGESYSVQFTKDELQLMKDGILTHNHPRGWGFAENELERIGNSFSLDDIALAVGNNLAEIRAVTPNYTFSMKRPNANWGVSVGELVKLYNEENRILRFEFGGRIDNETLTVSQANATHFHILWKRLAKKLGFDYSKMKTK